MPSTDQHWNCRFAEVFKSLPSWQQIKELQVFIGLRIKYNLKSYKNFWQWGFLKRVLVSLWFYESNVSKPDRGRGFNLQVLSLAWWFPASKITSRFFGIGSEASFSFQFVGNFAYHFSRLDLWWWEQQMLVLLKILILAAKSPFANFKIFTAESLDSHFLLLEESAEAGDAEILLWSFFPCPAWGVWRRAWPGWRMLIHLCSSCTGWLLLIVQQWKSTWVKQIKGGYQSFVYGKNINRFWSVHFLSLRAVPPLGHLLMNAICAQTLCSYCRAGNWGYIRPYFCLFI